MIDQSHNLKPKLEAMVQTVCEAQKLFTKAQLVDREALAVAQQQHDIVGAECNWRAAFDTDVSPLLAEWRRQHHLPADPLAELRQSKIIDRLARERSAKRENSPQSAAASYA